MWSLYCLSDITYSFMVCLAVLFAVKGMKRDKYFYLMGISLGLSYYAKGVTLALIPAFPIFYMIARGSVKALFRARRFLLGMLLVFMARFIFQENYGNTLWLDKGFANGESVYKQTYGTPHPYPYDHLAL
jgi:hypothetical protein